MTPYLLADDLSGALEAGAVFRAPGWRVVLPLAGDVASAGAGEVRIVTTESRNLDAGHAADAVRKAVLAAKAAGARLLLKKIDSTLRGPVGAEIAAMISVLSPPLVIVCPANPAAGRTTRHGMVRVHGVPLAATDFRNDPLWPARESSVANVLASQGVAAAGRLTLDELRGGGARDVLARAASGAAGAVIVADSESDSDLDALVEAASEACAGALLVGSGALAGALARRTPPPAGAGAAPAIPRLKSALVLCGSRHPASQRQLDHLSNERGIGVTSFVAGESDEAEVAEKVASDLGASGVAAVSFTTHGRSSAEAARRVLAAISQLAGAISGRSAPDAWILTGGETAWAACGALRGVSLEIVAELQPGIVISSLARRGSAPTFVITKPGGFGGAAALANLIG